MLFIRVQDNLSLVRCTSQTPTIPSESPTYSLPLSSNTSELGCADDMSSDIPCGSKGEIAPSSTLRMSRLMTHSIYIYIYIYITLSNQALLVIKIAYPYTNFRVKTSSGKNYSIIIGRGNTREEISGIYIAWVHEFADLINGLILDIIMIKGESGRKIPEFAHGVCATGNYVGVIRTPF